MNKNMAPRLPNLPCFEAFGVIFCVQIFVHIFALYAGGGGHWRISEKSRANCLSPTRELFFALFQNYPRSEGNCAPIARRKLSRGNLCPVISRCLFWPTGLVRSARTLSQIGRNK